MRGVGALELAAERGDEQVDLGGEVAVQRAEGDVGLLGDGAHLDGVEAALGGERDRRVEDPLAAVALRGGAEILDRQRVAWSHRPPSENCQLWPSAEPLRWVCSTRLSTSGP